MDVFVFSKKGDEGETSLLTGARVSKASLRPEAYGTLDEASSALGLAKTLTENSSIRQMIETVQEDLVLLGGELAWEGDESKYRIGTDRTRRLEQWIETLQEEVPIPREFIHPGGNPCSAAIDLARSVIRRAERRVVAMKEQGLIRDPDIHAYLNRLADFLFALARYAGKRG